MSGQPNINQTGRDTAIAVARGAVNYIPYVGPILAELFGTIIPNQRIDRVTTFAQMLNAKVEHMDQDLLEQKMRTEEFADLFEDGAFQAARTLTDERKEYIASLLKNSLSSEDLDHLQEKQLLSLLGDINDAELIILRSYGLDLDPQAHQQFIETHQDTVQGPLAVFGSSQEEADRSAIHQTYRSHLQRLGLVQEKYKKPKKNELPEWDYKTGMLKSSGTHITPLGRLLLRYIDAEVTAESDTE